MLFGRDGERLALLRDERRDELHRLGLAEIDALVHVGRIGRIGLEIDRDAGLQIDRRLARLFYPPLALQDIDELLSGVIMLAGLCPRLELGDEYRHLFLRVRLQRLFQDHGARHALLRACRAGHRDNDPGDQGQSNDQADVRFHAVSPSISKFWLSIYRTRAGTVNTKPAGPDAFSARLQSAAARYFASPAGAASLMSFNTGAVSCNSMSGITRYFRPLMSRLSAGRSSFGMSTRRELGAASPYRSEYFFSAAGPFRERNQLMNTRAALGCGAPLMRLIEPPPLVM